MIEKCILLIMILHTLSAGAFETAVITLGFPVGARSYAMGETGVALADDESALFHNPAGLGVPNQRWQLLGGSYFYEALLPALQLNDLDHSYAA
ncbi:MAG: hypothetical protein GF398_16450, partial [Chitinivibrionales bacterium]|nr:hypothetical protein [Chitinivibrionales bacterium]